LIIQYIFISAKRGFLKIMWYKYIDTFKGKETD